MIYECPVCKKKVNSISELKNCIVKHESDETANKGRINELETEIQAKYNELAKLISEYNKINTDMYKTLSITTTEKKRVKPITINTKPINCNKKVDQFDFLDNLDFNFNKTNGYYNILNEIINALEDVEKEDKKNG